MAVTLEPIERFRHIRIDRTPAGTLDGQTRTRVDAAWNDLCARNPRYFNGEILVFNSHDPHSGVLSARVDQYKHHAVRDTIDLGVSLLAVTAIVIADGRVLLGRRSKENHRYGGLWELGPSGGIDVPEGADRIDPADLLREATREIEEEAGFTPRVLDHRVIALVHDGFVGSTDLAVVVHIEPPGASEINWEYDDTRWLSPAELLAWCDESRERIIPTTHALARFLHEARP